MDISVYCIVIVIFFLGSTAFLAASLSFLKKWGYCFRRDEGYFGVLISFGAF